MEEVKINNNIYEIIKDYKNGFNEEEFKNKYTEYFEDYDYILGDIAYNKLRLKGFYEADNKKSNKINKISLLDDYLKNRCAYDCKYFVAKKVRL